MKKNEYPQGLTLEIRSAGSPLKETATAASIGRSALDYPDPAHFLTGLKRKRLAIGT